MDLSPRNVVKDRLKKKGGKEGGPEKLRNLSILLPTHPLAFSDSSCRMGPLPSQLGKDIFPSSLCLSLWTTHSGLGQNSDMGSEMEGLPSGA